MADTKLSVYSYEGPVYHFEHIVDSNFKCTTSAPTEKKALSNMTFKAKKALGFEPATRVTLDPKYLKTYDK